MHVHFSTTSCAQAKIMQIPNGVQKGDKQEENSVSQNPKRDQNSKYAVEISSKIISRFSGSIGFISNMITTKHHSPCYWAADPNYVKTPLQFIPILGL